MGSLKPGGWGSGVYVHLGNSQNWVRDRKELYKGLFGERVEGRVMEIMVLTCSSHAWVNPLNQ